MPVKAPMLMKPAWPRLSSPEMPTTRFRETAMTIQQQIGISCPFIEREMDLLLIMMVRMTKAMMTSPKVTRL